MKPKHFTGATKHRRYYREVVSGSERGVLPQRFMIAAAWASERHPQGRLLDLGCHEGIFAYEMRGKGMIVVGLEINETLAKKARKRIDPICSADMEEPWPFADLSFDVVHLGAVVEHLFNYPLVFAECSRVLTQSGSLIISTPNMGHIRHRLEVVFGRVPSWYRNFEHIRMWTIGYLAEKLRPHGLIVTRAKGAFEKKGAIYQVLSQIAPSWSSEIVVEAIKLNANP